MNCRAKSLALSLFIASLGLGCANMTETRTIAQWMDELEKEDITQVRDGSSRDFDERAFPLGSQTEPFAAIKVLNLPKGKLTVTKVVDEGARKKVQVEVAEEIRSGEKGGKKTRKHQLVFTLVRDIKDEKWVVDDVHQPEKKRSGDIAYRSVAEQMDLLLAVQRFDHVWEKGDREDVLDSCTARLARLLSELPPSDLDQILTAVHGKGSHKGKFGPKARMAEDTAEISMRKNDRTIVAVFRNIDGRWLVDDVAAKMSGRSRTDEKDITSIQDLTAVLIATNTFRTAYDGNDKKALAKICTVELFDGALAPADLRTFPLPDIKTVAGEQPDIKITKGQADFVVKDKDVILRISLVRNQDETPDAPKIYHVDDVTVFDWKNRQEKRLAAVFTAHQAMHVFSEALAERDLDMLEFLSTRDFQNRVWKKLNTKTVNVIPLDGVPNAAPIIENTVFQGPLTEITVSQGGKPITYVLRAHLGKMKVDDVLFPADGLPDSLKQTVELLIPIYQFAAGFQQRSLSILAQNSSRELNRTAWSQCKTLPSLGTTPQANLHALLRRIENSNPDNVQVILGDQNFGAVVWLVKEREAYRVDDVRLITGPDERRDHVQLKRHVRLTLAEGPVRKRRSLVVPADFEVAEEDIFPESIGSGSGSGTQVQQASGLEEEISGSEYGEEN